MRLNLPSWQGLSGRRKKLILISFFLLIVGLGWWSALRAVGGNVADQQSILRPSARKAVESIPQDFRLEIKKLKISAPIIKDVDGGNKKAYLKALEQGVAHDKQSVLPGTPGNIFIFGHSGYWQNRPGNYKEVFSTLDQLETGDEIVVYFEGKKHPYRVREEKIVAADDWSVLEKKDQETLTLMTCWPPKTLEKRYLIIADPITS